MQRAIGEHISHHRDRGCGLPRSMSSSVLLCQHCSQHVATAMPCPPSLSPPRCFRLCRGFAPLMRFVQDAAISQCSPGPPGRLRLRCICVGVCVLGVVMFQCRSMCFLLSGLLPLAVRLPLLSFGLAVAFVVGFGCSCGSLLTHRHSQLTRRAPHTHRTHHTLTTPSITLPHLALYTHTTSTPQHIHSSHTIIPTNSPPQTHSCSRKSEMANSLVLCACGCTLCFDQVYPN